MNVPFGKRKAKSFGNAVDHFVGGSDNQNGRGFFVKNGFCNGVGVGLLRKKSGFDGAYLGLLFFGGNTCGYGVFKYKKAVVNYGRNIQLFAQLYGVIAFSAAALTRQAVYFNLHFCGFFDRLSLLYTITKKGGSNYGICN